MAGLPVVTVAGTLTADPALRFTAAGAAVCSFTVAANDRKFNRETNQFEDKGATFLRCSIWRQAAENLAESAQRGDRVMVTGSLRQREYEKDGEKHTVYELDVEEVAVSLKFATAKVTKAARSGAGSKPSGPSDDPWAPQDDTAPPF